MTEFTSDPIPSDLNEQKWAITCKYSTNWRELLILFCEAKIKNDQHSPEIWQYRQHELKIIIICSSRNINLQTNSGNGCVPWDAWDFLQAVLSWTRDCLGPRPRTWLTDFCAFACSPVTVSYSTPYGSINKNMNGLRAVIYCMNKDKNVISFLKIETDTKTVSAFATVLFPKRSFRLSEC